MPHKPKATLEEMAAHVDDAALRERVSLDFHYSLGNRPDPAGERRAVNLDGAAEVLRTMATYPDKSRAFITGLRKDHANGR
jgi:hypothetical protein